MPPSAPRPQPPPVGGVAVHLDGVRGRGTGRDKVRGRGRVRGRGTVRGRGRVRGRVG